MKRLVIYAHYDGAGEVKPYVSHMLSALARLGDRLDFVSTASLAPEQYDLAAGQVYRVLTKKNEGFDFSMWQLALSDIELGDWDELVLANSSVFGPVSPLETMFEAMQARDCDFWGATDNHHISWHLQSYFLVFRRPVLKAPGFKQFWAGVLPYRDKFQVIRSYEIGLSNWLLALGLKGETYVPARSLFPAGPTQVLFRKRNLDMTMFYPGRLLKHGSPFVKVSLLRDNPGRVSLAAVRQQMADSGYDLGLL